MKLVLIDAQGVPFTVIIETPAPAMILSEAALAELNGQQEAKVMAKWDVTMPIVGHANVCEIEADSKAAAIQIAADRVGEYLGAMENPKDPALLDSVYIEELDAKVVVSEGNVLHMTCCRASATPSKE
jgi:hypothetical protein